MLKMTILYLYNRDNYFLILQHVFSFKLLLRNRVSFQSLAGQTAFFRWGVSIIKECFWFHHTYWDLRFSTVHVTVQIVSASTIGRKLREQSAVLTCTTLDLFFCLFVYTIPAVHLHKNTVKACIRCVCHFALLEQWCSWIPKSWFLQSCAWVLCNCHHNCYK